MRTRTFVFAVAAVVGGLLTVSSSGFAAPGDGGGGGGGGEPPDYGDLIILHRDANGVPIPSPEVTVTDPETGQPVDGGLCWQPIAFQTDATGTCPATLLDCAGQDPCLVPVDQYNCAVEAAYAGCTQEVDFGRINSARSPDSVYDSQLADVVVNLATADCVTLDPAGRLVASRIVDGEPLSGAIDSPLQNLAIYKQLISTGTLGVPLPAGADVLDTAARGIGAGSDKSGEVNVDLVAYLNETMGLTATTTILDPKICETYREEVQGVIQLVDKCFLNYGNYGYDRTTNFSALPDPAYIPADAPLAGTFEYLSYVLASSPPMFEIVYGPILDAVFCVDVAGDPLEPVSGVCTGSIDPGFLAGNIGGFAQAADDARAVIDFMHNWPVPGNFPTPVPCAASGVTSYDVSISDVSGLQVPVRMVAGTEGREFTLTVANAGPDEATGAVLLTATDANGNPVPTFPRTFTFTLAAGASQSWTESFSINYPTTITWTATVTAAFDVYPGNNSVTETTVVTGTAGGGTLDVADVVGLTEAAALAALDPQLVAVVNYANSDTVAAGLVISQVPAACTLCADPGDTVTLTVSLGPVASQSDVSISSVQIPLNLIRSGIVRELTVAVTNDEAAAANGTGTVTVSGTDGSLFTGTFTNLVPGASQSFRWAWTVPASQTVIWTIEVRVNGVVVDTETWKTVIR